MRRFTILAALGGTAQASPRGWHFEKHSHPGWSEPSVYTPAQPEPSWPYQPWSSQSTRVESTSSPGPTVTDSAPSTTTAASSTLSGGYGTSTAACASVSELVASFTSQSPSATPTVPAELAYDCITSVPFNGSAAVALLESIRPYLDWQTTIEYLKNPPAEYAANIQPPYDFYANFGRIYNNAVNGSYDNEYAFGFDLYRCFQIAHDGHFAFYPDSVTSIFTFGRTTPLVSVSVDGVGIPEVYAYADVLSASFGNVSFTPSPLTMIDGENSTEWLLDFSQYGSLQDRDALWNNVFYELAQVSLGASGSGTGTFSGGGRGRYIYPGPTTSLTFANGTNVTIENFARVLVPFKGITNGDDIYKTYFTPPPSDVESAEQLATMTTSSTSSSATASTTSSTSSTSSTSIPAPGYPSPIVREKRNLNSGYFLDGEGYDDVVVLSVPSFVGNASDERPFQSVNTYTINRALAANKTKLIIDVSANGGGTILQGYDLFKQLFPHILPYGATRFRAHEAFDLIGQEVSYYSGLVPRSPNTNETVQNLVSTSWNYRTDADVNYRPFTSWAEKFGPHAYGPGPDNFTSIIRWNLSDVLTPDNSGGIYVSGYLNRTNITTQPFAAEDIVIVYDGTCTIFSELMRQQAGVKTIALGGRPTRDIIQAVGGVKGTNDFPWTYILSGAEIPFQTHSLHNAAYYNNHTVLGQYSDLPLLRSTNAVVNSRDGLRQGDDTQTPLQFRYEPADCRIYYTPEMVVDVTAVWKSVADTAFYGVSHCVAGNYTAGTGGTKRHHRRHAPTRKHTVRRDLNGSEHIDSIANVWTGKGGVTLSGDAIMYV